MAKNKKNSISRTVGRIAIITVTVLLIVLTALYGVMWILVNGPSPTARRLFVLSVKETSAGGFLADIYLSEEEIAEIMGTSSADSGDEKTDTSLIQIPQKDGVDGGENVPAKPGEIITNPGGPSSGDGEETQNKNEGIEVLDVVGSTYNGKLMIIDDPSRVFVGIPGEFGEGHSGLSVAAMIDKYGAVAGTNAGGFDDPNGTGTGGIPDGIVIYEGELKWGSLGSTYNLAGLDKNGILHVGNMTAAHALDIGIQYAASYGPALVINGQPAGSSMGGGLNPRTAIGQRADGAILLLVINGRSIDSLGATLDDLIEIMLSHGAVNASNLDGGSSSIMIMNGERLTSSAYIFGERVVATGIIVK